MRYLIAMTAWLISILVSVVSFAEETPSASVFDSRVQSVSYNAQDIAKINTKLGFITTIIFSEGEVIEKAVTGFDAGWKIEIFRNKLFIMPVPVEQQLDADDDEDYGGSGMKKFAPIPSQWDTNLFVSTNKRNYNMVLNIATSNDKPAHMLQFAYHDEKHQKQALNAGFANARQGKNYDYFVKAGSNSQLIVPDFAYDDGEMTYFGFSPAKQLPSIFSYRIKENKW